MSEPMNLYEKIREVMKDVEYLQKDDSVSTGGNNSYRAISEEKVTQTVREALIKHGLVIFPIEQAHSREELRDKEGILKGYLSIVDTKYKIVDVETGQFEIIASSGTGADSQDKGVGKAATYSYKYLLLRTFAIPTGEDPDKVSSATLDEKHELEKQKAAEQDAKLIPSLKAKWQTLAGNMDGFDEWHYKQTEAKVTNAKMNEFLAKKLTEKKEK